jgi:hypothetical protein
MKCSTQPRCCPCQHSLLRSRKCACLRWPTLWRCGSQRTPWPQAHRVVAAPLSEEWLAFAVRFNQIAEQAEVAMAARLCLMTPFIGLRLADLIDLGQQFVVPLGHTWSCNEHVALESWLLPTLPGPQGRPQSGERTDQTKYRDFVRVRVGEA